MKKTSKIRGRIGFSEVESGEPRARTEAPHIESVMLPSFEFIDGLAGIRWRRFGLYGFVRRRKQLSGSKEKRYATAFVYIVNRAC